MRLAEAGRIDQRRVAEAAAGGAFTTGPASSNRDSFAPAARSTLSYSLSTTCTPRCCRRVMTTRRSLSKAAAVTARVTSSAFSGSAAGDALRVLRREARRPCTQMLLDQSADGPQHEIGRDRVGELGEQNDHRTPREARCKRRQRKSVVGLVGAVIDLRGHALELGEGAAAGDEAARAAAAANRTR